MIAALTQLYREQGRYLERVYKWAKRVGIDTVRKQIMDDRERRKALYERFVVIAEIRADRSVGRARRRQGCARVRAAGRSHDQGGRGMSTHDRHAWIDIGPLDAIPVRGARVVRARGRLHRRVPHSRRRGVRHRRRCPHKAGPLSQGIVHGKSVTCPLHNWVISLESGAAQGADEGQVRTYPLEDRGRPHAARSRSRRVRCGDVRLEEQLMSDVRPHDLPLLRRRLRRHGHAAAPTARSRSPAIPSIPPTSAGCARKVRRSARRCRWTAGCCIP